MTNEIARKDYAAILEKVIIANDLAGLTPTEKVQHIKAVCESIGLNPLTKPIQLIKFQGKETMYFSKDATEQLRKVNHISVHKIEKEWREDIYIVTAYLKDEEGREDVGTGAVSIAGLKGDALCNAIMKAESKAKRRATLSICGLGFAMDESETETIPSATKTDPQMEEQIHNQCAIFMDELDKCKTLDELKNVFDDIKAFNFSGHKDLLSKLIARKDEIKLNIMQEESIKKLEGTN